MSLDGSGPSTAILMNSARRAAVVRWSWRLLFVCAIVGILLAPAVLSGLILPGRLVLLGIVPLVVLGMTASGTLLLLFAGTCPRKVRRVTSRPAAMPRQFGIGPMLLLVTLYAIAFSMLQSVDARGPTYGFVAAFLAAVILGQVFFFRGRQPRKASALAGLIVGGPIGLAMLSTSAPSLSRLQDPLYLALYLFYAPLNIALVVAVATSAAYLFGCLVSGIFLLRYRLDTGCWTLPAEEPTSPEPDMSETSRARTLIHPIDVPVRRQRIRRIGAVVLVIVAILLLNWYDRQARRFLQQWEALTAIREAQGYVERSGGNASGADKEFRTSVRDQVHWLRMIFSDVDSVIFYHVDLPWGQLAALGHFDCLRIRTPAPLREADLVHLQEVPCDALEIDFTSATENGLTCLKRLTRFSRLSVDLTRIPVTDAMLESLADLPGLDRLVLIATPITDESLAVVARIPKLRSLNLGNTAVTDAGLEHLKGLAGLRFLRLCDTKATRQAVQKLADQLPSCKVFGPGRARVQPQNPTVDEEIPVEPPDQPLQ